jgi:twitching motility protein PilT
MKDPLTQYRLRKFAAQLRQFTVPELASASKANRPIVQAFVNRLEKAGSDFVMKANMDAAGVGRPLVRYGLTLKGVAFLASEIAPIAKQMNEPVRLAPTVDVGAVMVSESRPSWAAKIGDWLTAFAADFQIALEIGASTLLLKPGEVASIRIGEEIEALPGGSVWSESQLEDTLRQILTPWQSERLATRGWTVSASRLENRILWGMRVQRVAGHSVVEVRKLPTVVPKIEDLYLPPLVSEFAGLKSGLVLITGIGRSGRSATLAAIVNRINETRPQRVITLEEPILYCHQKNRSFIEQRQIALDAPDFAPGLNQALDDDAEVVALSDLSDHDTLSTALVASERRLIFARVAAADPEEAFRKLTSFFPPLEQTRAHERIASSLAGVVAVTGLESAAGSHFVPATAVLRVDEEVRSVFADPGQLHRIAQLFEVDSSRVHTLRSSVQELHRNRQISAAVAERYLLRSASADSEADAGEQLQGAAGF